MKPRLRAVANFCVAGVIALLCQVDAGAQNLPGSQAAPPAAGFEAPAQRLEQVGVPKGSLNLTPTRPEAVAHIHPTVPAIRGSAAAADPGPLVYHAGGSVMQPLSRIYLIFWDPPTLQNGNSSVMSSNYIPIIEAMARYYPGHSLSTNNTQYYETIAGTTNYVAYEGGLAGVSLDKTPFPPSGCTDTATPGNCVSDVQMRTKIQNVIASQGWPNGGLTNLFLLFTPSGEGSCFSSNSCAYTEYCGYHSFISNGANSIIYAHMPYGGTSQCVTLSQTSPNNDKAADGAANVTSHEITEALTDPLLDAWYTAQGNEIGDLCNFTFGTNTWDAAAANQMWNGYFSELQLEWSNHSNSCVSVGP